MAIFLSIFRKVWTFLLQGNEHVVVVDDDGDVMSITLLMHLYIQYSTIFGYVKFGVSVILCCVCMHDYMSRVFTFYNFLVVTRRVIYSQSSSRHWLSACFQEWKLEGEQRVVRKISFTISPLLPQQQYSIRSYHKNTNNSRGFGLFLGCWLAILMQVEKKVSGLLGYTITKPPELPQNTTHIRTTNMIIIGKERRAIATMDCG